MSAAAGRFAARSHTAPPPRERPKKTMRAGSTSGRCRQLIVGPGEGLRYALLGGASGRPAVTRVFHQQQAHSHRGKSLERLRPEIDQLAVAVSENNRRRRRARDTGGRWKIPGLNPAEARVQPRRLDSGGAEIHRCGARDHVARKNHLPLRQEQQQAIGRVNQNCASDDFDQSVHLRCVQETQGLFNSGMPQAVSGWPRRRASRTSRKRSRR